MAKQRSRRSSATQTQPKQPPQSPPAEQQPPAHQPSSSDEDPAGAAEAPPESKGSSTLRNLGVAAVVAILAVQLVLLFMTLRTNNEVAELRDDIDALGAGGLATDSLRDLGGGLASPGPASPAPEADGAAPASGNLPRFLGGGADAALGRNIGDLTALEYYTGENRSYGAGDGVSRAYMVWAHWCPFCQEELPVVADWQNENAAAFENFELVTVTTAMDETAENPLVPYLEDSRFPFPVLFDEDGSLSRKLGVNAFPFWVFVAPDGTVVGRAAGFIELDNLTTVFQQLDDMAAEGPSAMPALD